VIDDDGRLVEPGDLVNASRGVEREFVQPLLEIKTTPCATTAELHRELFGRIEAVLDRADAAGKGLVPLATPVGEELIRDRPSERTRVQDRVLGEDFEYVRHCAGTHLHVEQSPGEPREAVAQVAASDRLVGLDGRTWFDRQRGVDGQVPAESVRNVESVPGRRVRESRLRARLDSDVTATPEGLIRSDSVDDVRVQLEGRRVVREYALGDREVRAA
jgi:hypothetical protein